MDNHTGKIGEAYTVHWLQNRGYQVLEQNYHSPYGEIDIIAQKDPYIVFVEVKTRCIPGKSHPLESITVSKQKRIIQTALYYLSVHPQQAKWQIRFDAAGILTQRGTDQIMEITYLPNAFEGELV